MTIGNIKAILDSLTLEEKIGLLKLLEELKVKALDKENNNK